MSTNNKFKFKPFKITKILLCFSCISLFSIGLSSFIRDDAMITNIHLNLISGIVVSKNDAINFKKFTLFDCCKDGFIQDDIITLDTNIETELSIDCSFLNEYDLVNSSQTILLELTQNNGTNLVNFLSCIANYNVTSTPELIFEHAGSLSADLTTYSIKITLNQETLNNDLIDFKINYSIDANKLIEGSSFNDKIFSLIQNQNIIFTMAGGLDE